MPSSPTDRDTVALPYSLGAKAAAEALGTFWLVLGGVGAAVLAGEEIGFAGIALAFGLSVLTAAYAVGHISGGHFNPAVTLGLAIAGRCSWREVPVYIGTQLVAALVAAATVLAIASGGPGFSLAESGLAANGYGDASPGGYVLWAAAVTEIALTAVFVLVILGATDTRAPRGFAPLSIGLALTLVHLISIPVSNTSVNPARSFGPAVLSGGTALEQLWAFVVFPLAGAALAGLVYGGLFGDRRTAALADTTRA